MRLREVREILVNSIPNLKLKVKQNPSNGNFYDIQDIALTNDTLLKLQEFNFLNEQIERAKSFNSIFNSRLNITTIENSNFQTYLGILNYIINLSNAVIDVIDQIIPKQNEFSISVKLPEMNNLKDLLSFTSELDKCLSQVLINEHFDGKVELQNFESGSNWYEIIIGSMLALTVVKDLVNYAFVVRKKIIDIEMTKQNLRAITIATDAMESIEKGLDKSVKDLCELNAKELLDKNNVTGENAEYILRVSNSIKIMADLLNKGTEVHLALNAPKEIKDDFPSFKKIISTISEIKKITDGNTEDK